jgi:anti-sigma factor RsiW
MKCLKIESLLPLYIYDELTGKEKESVTTHLRTCSACASKVAQLKETMSLYSTNLETAPEPDWERSWLRIQERLEMQAPMQQKKASTYRSTFRWAGALAASVAIFVIGLLTGTQLQQTPPKPELLTTNPGTTQPQAIFHKAEYFQEQLSQHMEDIKPVIVQYANYWADKGTSATLPLPIEKKNGDRPFDS